MDFLHRLLDRLDLLIAGLSGVIVASWWHKDDLTDWRACDLLDHRGVLLAVPDGNGERLRSPATC